MTGSAVTLVFRDFNGNAGDFDLFAEHGRATGGITLGSCMFDTEQSSFPLGQGPQRGDQIRLDPCEVTPRGGNPILIAVNADTEARLVSETAVVGTPRFALSMLGPLPGPRPGPLPPSEPAPLPPDMSAPPPFNMPAPPPSDMLTPLPPFIPSEAVYDIVIDGETRSIGDSAGRRFSHRAILVVVATLNDSPEFDNGVNPVDVGLFTAEANPLLGTAGALYFVTNTSLAALVGAIPGSNVDVTFVAIDEDTEKVSIVVDEMQARLGVLNLYNVPSGLATQIHHVLAGTVSLQFSPDAADVSGTIALSGNSGFSGPLPSAEYLATFRGVQID